jgi:pyridoxine 5'-phosphate synthase PdxJ
LEYAVRKVQANLDRLKLSGTHQLLVYADDDNLLCKNLHTAQWASVHQNLAEVELQASLEHTTSCIVQAHEILLAVVAGKNIQKIVYI